MVKEGGGSQKHDCRSSAEPTRPRLPHTLYCTRLLTEACRPGSRPVRDYKTVLRLYAFFLSQNDRHLSRLRTWNERCIIKCSTGSDRRLRLALLGFCNDNQCSSDLFRTFLPSREFLIHPSISSRNLEKSEMTKHYLRLQRIPQSKLKYLFLWFPKVFNVKVVQHVVSVGTIDESSVCSQLYYEQLPPHSVKRQGRNTKW